MKSLLIFTGLGLSLNLIGCQGSFPNKNVSVSPPAPLYSQLTDEDIEKADQALQDTLETLPSERNRLWENNKSGNSGIIMPLRTYKSKAGYYCREYRELINVRQEQAVYYDTACRNKDGKWYPI